MDVKLVMFKANGQRKEFPLDNDATIIGRSGECRLRVPLLSVSRRHCELEIVDDALVVKDLASSNGTYVNNQRVQEQELKPGDRLTVGPVVFTIQIDGQPEEIQPPQASRPSKKPRVKMHAMPDDDIVDLGPDGLSDEDALKAISSPADTDDDGVDVISELEDINDGGEKAAEEK